jgi:hypothetical protein
MTWPRLLVDQGYFGWLCPPSGGAQEHHLEVFAHRNSPGRRGSPTFSMMSRSSVQVEAGEGLADHVRVRWQPQPVLICTTEMPCAATRFASQCPDVPLVDADALAVLQGPDRPLHLAGLARPGCF